MHPSRRFTAENWRAAHDWQVAWDPDVAYSRFGRRSPRWVRVWGPVIVSFFVQVPASLLVWDRVTGERSLRGEGWELVLLLGLALIGPVALIFARRFPGPVVAIVALAASIDLILAGASDGPPYIALAFAIGSAIIRGARVWAWASIAGSWLVTVIVSLLIGIPWQPWRVIGVTIGILILVGFSEVIRTRREQFEQVRTTVLRRRQSEVQAERVRIARELHDVLAHSLSQINVQAGVGLHLMEKQPEKAAAALASIKETSKVALDEVRSVLGVLRAEDGADPTAPLVPEPDLSRIAGLVASVTAQGVDVALTTNLDQVPKATQLAIYRIVQESLTNVVRHSHATRATVVLDETAHEFTVTVTDNGTGPLEPTEGGGGRGVLGMRERAELLGGHLEARAAHPGFVVVATIPKKESLT